MHGYENFPFMGIGMIISIIFIILVFAMLFKKNDNNKCSAQDILDKRYANGEIGFEEYCEKCKNLKKG